MDRFINRILDLSQSNDYQTDDHFLLPFTSWFIVVELNSKDTNLQPCVKAGWKRTQELECTTSKVTANLKKFVKNAYTGCVTLPFLFPYISVEQAHPSHTPGHVLD